MWLHVPESSLSVPVSTASASASDACFQRLARSVMSKSRHMQPRYWRAAWQKGGWITRLSGAICEPSTLDAGVERWISSLLDSPVSRSVDGPQSLSDTPTSRRRLNSQFVEWPDGLPDRVDAGRTDRLRAIGNAVVPAQAEFALRLLLDEIRRDDA